jgi:hypothetical protein
MTITPDPILTATEVAADLRCSKAHVHKLINGTVAGAPPLPAIHIGRRVVVRRSTLELWKARSENVVAGATLGASLNVDAAGAPRSKS